ncbi:MAG: hypothetical protein KJ941_05795 [Bacteroidetes bacterium]|nr:hypothetical protein [Bacteroidota bacterium]
MLRFLIVLLLFVGCQMTPKSDDEIGVSGDDFAQIELFESKMASIDSRISEFQIGNSLAYINNDQSTEEVFAYLDKGGNVVKMEEKFFNAKTQNRGIRYFYLENGKRIVSRELIIDKVNHNGSFIERISFYNEKGKPVYTKERFSEYEDEIETHDFSQVTPFDCSMKMAMMVLNQEGPFKTTFQGFFANGPMDYLIVGGPGASDFTSSLLVQFEDTQVTFLKKNERRMINTPLVVNYEKMVDQQNFEFQVLLKVDIVTE